ncbi:MAG: hypothetical protein KatS3mg031_2309 [Chitinophagales bacterium]|nr:MAG: hypothetical protein KatS3mg031_2309 [Chitinophagales bacterium]
MYRRMILAGVLVLLAGFLHAQISCSTLSKIRVLLVGDSWTHIMWNNRTYQDVFNQFGFADIAERGTYTAIGGTTASFWAAPANLQIILNELQQHPTVDIVVLSIGGNDMLAGMNVSPPGWHTGLSAGAETQLFDRIQADIQTIVDGIKSVRPNIEIVFSGYDYLNFVETVINDQGGNIILMWANLGQPNAFQINSAFSRFEQRKINIANADPRVYYVHALGLMQHIYGYPGIFSPFSVPAPGQTPPLYAPFPGGDPNFPTPPVALANNGLDAIHLSDDGYRHLVVNQMLSYLLNKFRGNPPATFHSQGGLHDGWVRSDGNLGVGGVRVGDQGSGMLYRGILSFNTDTLPDQAVITGASLFINRAALSGTNPFQTGMLGPPSVDVKTGSFGGAAIEVSDYFSAADAVNAGCFVGTAPADGYTIRIDLTPAGFGKINKTGLTQFRLSFSYASGSANDYVQFHTGDQPGLLAPYLDVFYTLPSPPATARVYGDTVICSGSSASIYITLSGSPPWNITWSDGVTETGLTSPQHVRSVSPLVTTTYQIVQLTDAQGSGTPSGSAYIEVLPSVPVSVSGLASHYCVNTPPSTLLASPPGGVWSGPGITGTIFNPALAVLQSGGGGIISLTYSGTYLSCPYSKDFPVVVDSASCTTDGSCSFAPVSGTVSCVGARTLNFTYSSSGRLYVFKDLIPGKTYVASTCDSCGFDSHLMIRDESDSSFIAENNDACATASSVTFVAPPSGKIGIHLSAADTFPCNGYACNPYNCNPYPCNPHSCNPYSCNCQTCYQTCYRDTLVYMTCYPGGIQFINGYLTSDCIGACTFGFCWRMQYQVPYDCNPYLCNCQTCYQTCYDTCYQTCYDTCYQTCSDVCGTDNMIPCTVSLRCVDCQIPAAVLSASRISACMDDSIQFAATVYGATCNTTYLWNFGTDAQPTSSNQLNPPPVRWTTSGTKQISFTVTEPGVGSHSEYLLIHYADIPSGSILNGPSVACPEDTILLTLDSSLHATDYYWNINDAVFFPSGDSAFLVMPDSSVTVKVVPANGLCFGDTVSLLIRAQQLAPIEITALGGTELCPGDTVVLTTSYSGGTLQWQRNEQDIGISGNTLIAQEAGLYRLRVSDTSGCFAYSNVIAIVEYPAPEGSLTITGLACAGDTVWLSADYTNFSALKWFRNDSVIPGISDSLLPVTTSGTYSLVVSNSYCTDSLSSVITFHPKPIADAGPDREICLHDTVVLTATGGIHYRWHTGAQTAQIAIAPTYSMLFIVEVLDSAGCASFDSVQVIVHPLPPPPHLAIHGNLITAASSYAAYQWFLNGAAIAGATSDTLLIVASGNYSLQVSDSNGCTMLSAPIYVELTGLTHPVAAGVLYPNPVRDFLKLQLPASEKCRWYCLQNIAGKTLECQTTSCEPMRVIDLSAYPAGLYVLKVEGGGIFKIVKE